MAPAARADGHLAHSRPARDAPAPARRAGHDAKKPRGAAASQRGARLPFALDEDPEVAAEAEMLRTAAAATALLAEGSEYSGRFWEPSITPPLMLLMAPTHAGEASKSALRRARDRSEAHLLDRHAGEAEEDGAAEPRLPHPATAPARPAKPQPEAEAAAAAAHAAAARATIAAPMELCKPMEGSVVASVARSASVPSAPPAAVRPATCLMAAPPPSPATGVLLAAAAAAAPIASLSPRAAPGAVAARTASHSTAAPVADDAPDDFVLIDAPVEEMAPGSAAKRKASPSLFGWLFGRKPASESAAAAAAATLTAVTALPRAATAPAAVVTPAPLVPGSLPSMPEPALLAVTTAMAAPARADPVPLAAADRDCSCLPTAFVWSRPPSAETGPRYAPGIATVQGAIKWALPPHLQKTPKRSMPLNTQRTRDIYRAACLAFKLPGGGWRTVHGGRGGARGGPARSRAHGRNDVRETIRDGLAEHYSAGWQYELEAC